jgi:hypothetical protein
MGVTLIVVGIIWAIFGGANIIGLPWTAQPPATNVITFGFIFNMVLFVLPGLAVAGIGKRISSKKPEAVVAPLDPKERIAKLAELLEHGLIDQAEYDFRRAKILSEI